MTYVRQQVGGTTPQDTMRINENFEQLWGKVFGDINFSDGNTDLKNRISTQWLPAQGEGNLSTGFPLYVRFYIPPDVKTVKSTSFNIMLSRYRMDSGVAENNEEKAITSASTTVANTTAVASAGGDGGIDETFSVDKWHTTDAGDYIAPSPGGSGVGRPVALDSHGFNGRYLTGSYNGHGCLFLPTSEVSYPADGGGTYVSPYPHIDMWFLQHTHRFLKDVHSHAITVQPHSHNVTMSITLPAHTHPLAEGIKVSTNAPATVTIKLNGTSIGTIAGENTSQNNLDVKDNVNIGQWNVFEFSCTGVARITVYGIIEMILKYFD